MDHFYISVYKHGRHISQIADYKGKNNPNYGNRALSEKYSHDKLLAKEKQARPGAKNGRAKPIKLILQDGTQITFPYMLKCAEYLVQNKLVRSSSPDGILPYISKAAKNNTTYYKYKFSFID